MFITSLFVCKTTIGFRKYCVTSFTLKNIFLVGYTLFVKHDSQDHFVALDIITSCSHPFIKYNVPFFVIGSSMCSKLL